jgi:hypothetical protein
VSEVGRPPENCPHGIIWRSRIESVAAAYFFRAAPQDNAMLEGPAARVVLCKRQYRAPDWSSTKSEDILDTTYRVVKAAWRQLDGQIRRQDG